MEYRRLGKSGLKLSALSFGSWVTFGNQADETLARECMTLAYDEGVNFFDNAEVYADGESERLMGAVLKKSGWSRDSYCVSSKVFWGGEKPTQMGLSRKHVHDACHAALARLQVDYLDLYFCHRPDIHTPVEETVWAMNDLIRQGKVLYWGTSEWSAQQITEAHAAAARFGLIGPTMEQPEYNLFSRDKVERDYFPLYDSYGLGITTWSPLASGLLTGKYNAGVPAGSRMTVPGYEWLKDQLVSEEGLRKVKRARQFTELAKEMDVAPAQLAIAWCLRNPRVSTVILGASRASQLKENLGAFRVLPKLTEEIVAKIEDLFENKPRAVKDFTE